MPSAIDAKFPSFQVQGVKILRGRSVLGPDPNRRSGPLSSKWERSPERKGPGHLFKSIPEAIPRSICTILAWDSHKYLKRILAYSL
ncbi:hypothetical protein CEXT_75821 [Caerostris extrusa]|uniref:Uncharacterized protein n=1 Tax=Caerostris extrusa TaxID=172846 RepID=A0AAV4WW25_CAEEX|nr:hypothetical protein CEXT_75821 [Caerostris extrusa]